MVGKYDRLHGNTRFKLQFHVDEKVFITFALIFLPKYVLCAMPLLWF